MSDHRCPGCGALCDCTGEECTHAYSYPDECNRGMEGRASGFGRLDRECAAALTDRRPCFLLDGASATDVANDCLGCFRDCDPRGDGDHECDAPLHTRPTGATEALGDE